MRERSSRDRTRYQCNELILSEGFDNRCTQQPTDAEEAEIETMVCFFCRHVRCAHASSVTEELERSIPASLLPGNSTNNWTCMLRRGSSPGAIHCSGRGPRYSRKRKPHKQCERPVADRQWCAPPSNSATSVYEVGHLCPNCELEFHSVDLSNTHKQVER